MSIISLSFESSLWSCHVLDTVAYHVEDSKRKNGAQQSPHTKTKDETLGEMSHVPHGEENISVVKGPTHTGSGVPQESIRLLQYLILLGLCVVIWLPCICLNN